jgi:polar amino acid transport system substrate-binding protein
MKKIISIVLSVMMLLSVLAGCAAGSTEGKLVYATSADYPPFEFHMLDENGKDVIVGIDVSVAKKIAEDMGLELEIVDISFDNLLTAMDKGECDMVIAAMEQDAERDKVADFSDPYYTDLPPMIVVKKGNEGNYSALADFSGKTVGAQSGTTKLDIVTNDMTGANSKALASVTDLINELVYDKVDAVVLDGAVAKKYAAANDKLAIVEAVSLGDAAAPFHVWVQKDDPKSLLGDINAAIKDVVDGGKIGTWYELADELGDKSLF